MSPLHQVEMLKGTEVLEKLGCIDENQSYLLRRQRHATRTRASP